jgi:hypothetical protein
LISEVPSPPSIDNLVSYWSQFQGKGCTAHGLHFDIIAHTLWDIVLKLLHVFLFLLTNGHKSRSINYIRALRLAGPP